MADFDISIEKVLAHEGGLAEEVGDPGEITNFGWSLQLQKRINPDATANDIRNLTRDQAKANYKTVFWLYDGIADQALADKILDMAVQFGTPTINLLVKKLVLPNAKDSYMGPPTIDAINRRDAAELLVELRARHAVLYTLSVLDRLLSKMGLAKNEKVTAGLTYAKQFLLGWMRRAVS